MQLMRRDLPVVLKTLIDAVAHKVGAVPTAFVRYNV